MDQLDESIIVADVVGVVVETLGLRGPSAELTADTALLGGISEFDSLAVVELITALEQRFGIRIEDDDVTAEAFATIGTLAGLVEEKTRR